MVNNKKLLDGLEWSFTPEAQEVYDRLTRVLKFDSDVAISVMQHYLLDHEMYCLPKSED